MSFIKKKVGNKIELSFNYLLFMALLKLSLLALAFLRGSQRQTWSVTVFNQRIKTEIRIKSKSGCFTKH